MPKRSTITGSLKRLAVWLIILSIWEGAYRTLGQEQDLNVPTPSRVADSLLWLLNIHTSFGDPIGPGWPRGRIAGPPREEEPIYRSRLVMANVVSAERLVVGFAISLVLGGFLGLAMWRFTALEEFLGPLFLGLQTLPSVCWVPLGMLLFGLNESGVLFVLVMGSFFAIAIALRDGLKTIPPIYQRAGLMLGADGWRLYRYVLLPASLPALAGSLRQGFSFAWRSLMGAELIFAVKRGGLGRELDLARGNGVADVVGVMLIMVLIGMAADRLVFARLQARIQARFGLG